MALRPSPCVHLFALLATVYIGSKQCVLGVEELGEVILIPETMVWYEHDKKKSDNSSLLSLFFLQDDGIGQLFFVKGKEIDEYKATATRHLEGMRTSFVGDIGAYSDIMSQYMKLISEGLQQSVLGNGEGLVYWHFPRPGATVVDNVALYFTVDRAPRWARAGACGGEVCLALVPRSGGGQTTAPQPTEHCNEVDFCSTYAVEDSRLAYNLPSGDYTLKATFYMHLTEHLIHKGVATGHLAVPVRLRPLSEGRVPALRPPPPPGPPDPAEEEPEAAAGGGQRRRRRGVHRRPPAAAQGAAGGAAAAARCAIATVLYSDSYLPGVLALRESARRHVQMGVDFLLRPITMPFLLTTLPLGRAQVLVPPSAGTEEEGKEGLSADALEILSDLGARVVFTEGMPKLSPGLLYPQLGGEIWIKLFLWQLEEYESIFCLDADSILLQNLDQVLLASLAWKSQGVHLAVREYTTSDYFFGGYFIVFPSRNTYEEMMKELVGGNDIFNHAEMDFLNLYFGTRKRVALEEAHFCMSARLKSTEHLSHCKAIDFMSCGALKWKPWHRLSRLVGKTVCGDEDPFSQHFLDVVEIWRELFSSSKQSLRPSALLLFEELMKMTSKYYDDSSKTVHGKDDDGNVSIYFEHHDRFM